MQESLAIALFDRDGNVEAFRRSLAEAVRRKMTLYRRYEDGKPIPPSYVSMTAGKKLMQNALVTADYALAIEVAELIGGRPEIETRNDHVFDRSFGYSIKHLLLRQDQEAAAIIETFGDAAATTKADHSYAQVLEAILAGNESSLSDELSKLEVAHKRLVTSGRWKDTMQELICIEGLALWNLAIHRSMECSATNSFIPTALVVSKTAP